MFVGVLLIIGFIIALIDHVAVFLFPSFDEFSLVGMLPTTLAEFSTCLWLLVKGAKIPEEKS